MSLAVYNLHRVVCFFFLEEGRVLQGLQKSVIYCGLIPCGPVGIKRVAGGPLRSEAQCMIAALRSEGQGEARGRRNRREYLER